MAISRLHVFHLNEIFLKNRINNIKTLALLRTWKVIADSISFKRPWNCLLDYCHRFEFNQHRLGLQVLKMSFFDTLGAPLNKQMLWVWIPPRRERIILVLSEDKCLYQHNQIERTHIPFCSSLPLRCCCRSLTSCSKSETKRDNLTVRAQKNLSYL